MNPKITVLTPTYNRASTIYRVWESLCQQSFRDFEWVVVDDGSEDNTLDQVQKWAAESEFDIIVTQLDGHKGKPFADNQGIRAARGQFICPMDSDDSFEPDALESFVAAWDSIPEEEKENFCGVTARTREAGREDPHGPPFPSDPFDVSFLDLYYVHKRREEQANFLRRDLLLNHPFPEVDEFVPESSVWHSLGRRYKTRCINAVVRNFHLGSPHALTGAGGIRFPRGRSFAIAHFVNEHHAHFGRLPTRAAREILNYGRYVNHCDQKFREALNQLEPYSARILFYILYPVSAVVAQRDRVLGKVS